ncbi:hypothetical protein ASF69_10125 [Rhizobium sp. Leaf311]|nr:hypothetical protein ASF69_10125 [Rhizobium sp. Leaf311]
MAGPVGGVSVIIANFDGYFHQMIEILEGIFQPLDLRESSRHMDADFEEGVAHFCGKPSDAHDICHLSMDIEEIRSVVFEKDALSGHIEIFATVDLGPFERVTQRAQAFRGSCRDCQ